MKQISKLIIVILFFVLVYPVQAMTTRSGDNIIIPKDEVVKGTLFAGGQTITVDGSIDGDLFCGAQTLQITGTVTGDVICGAQTIRIDGSVSGNLRAGAQIIDIAGVVGKNITAGAQNLTLAKSATVGGELIFAGKLLSNLGTVSGTVTHYEPKETKPVVRRPEVIKSSQSKAGSILGNIIFFGIIGLILVAVAPKWTGKIRDIIVGNPAQSVGIGCLFIFIAPVIIIATMLTIIGIPIAVIGAVLLAAIIIIGQVIASLAVGRFIVDKTGKGNGKSDYIPVIVGIPAAQLVFAVPVLGGLLGFLATVWGVGGIVQSRKK